MAALSENDRVSVWATVMERASEERASVNLTKEELRAAIDAVDDWIDANAASFNSALPCRSRHAPKQNGNTPLGRRLAGASRPDRSDAIAAGAGGVGMPSG